ncbi:unnamed protein product, partial [Trichogramma brassicae]
RLRPRDPSKLVIVRLGVASDDVREGRCTASSLGSPFRSSLRESPRHDRNTSLRRTELQARTPLLHTDTTLTNRRCAQQPPFFASPQITTQATDVQWPKTLPLSTAFYSFPHICTLSRSDCESVCVVCTVAQITTHRARCARFAKIVLLFSARGPSSASEV